MNPIREKTKLLFEKLQEKTVLESQLKQNKNDKTMIKRIKELNNEMANIDLLKGE